MKLKSKTIIEDGKEILYFYEGHELVAKYDPIEQVLDTFKNWTIYATSVNVKAQICQEYRNEGYVIDFCETFGFKFDRRYIMSYYGGLKIFLDKQCNESHIVNRHDNDLLAARDMWNKHITNIHLKEKNIKLLSNKL